ncbi:hypothetical protein HAX54_052570, partial [Datura stramonium]|nr:hypothetical protein [Datura stramonium]
FRFEDKNAETNVEYHHVNDRKSLSPSPTPKKNPKPSIPKSYTIFLFRYNYLTISAKQLRSLCNNFSFGRLKENLQLQKEDRRQNQVHRVSPGPIKEWKLGPNAARKSRNSKTYKIWMAPSTTKGDVGGMDQRGGSVGNG